MESVPHSLHSPRMKQRCTGQGPRLFLNLRWEEPEWKKIRKARKLIW